MSWAEIIMAAEGKRLSNNMAGIEFVACMETIKEFLQKSWKHSQIHRQLKQEGKITMSYGAFCYHMRRLSLDQHKPGETPPPVQAKKIAPGTPVTLAVRSENMIFDETCQSGMEAVVVEKSFAGGLLRVVLKLADGTEVIANRHGIDAGVQPGQKVTCHFDAENAVLVDLPS